VGGGGEGLARDVERLDEVAAGARGHDAERRIRRHRRFAVEEAVDDFVDGAVAADGDDELGAAAQRLAGHLGGGAGGAQKTLFEGAVGFLDGGAQLGPAALGLAAGGLRVDDEDGAGHGATIPQRGSARVASARSSMRSIVCTSSRESCFLHVGQAVTTVDNLASRTSVRRWSAMARAVSGIVVGRRPPPPEHSASLRARENSRTSSTALPARRRGASYTPSQRPR